MPPKARPPKAAQSSQHQRNNSQHQPGKPTKGQRLEAMARKKDERAVRKQQQQKKKDPGTSDDKTFAEQLAVIGLKIRDVIGDGNCLFRALGDQLEGDDRAHIRHRQDVVRYITEHRADFEPFIEDDVPFDKHIQNLAVDGTFGGNDSIVAFARLHKLTVVIHQLDSPVWEVHGEAEGTASNKIRQLHISYHNGDHYASVRRIDDTSDSPANVRIEPARPLPVTPASVKKNCLESSKMTDKMQEVVVNGDTMVIGGGSPDCDFSNSHSTHFVDKVMEFTRCQDHQLVAELCEEAGYFDIDVVCSNVLAFMDGVRSSSSSSSPSDGEINVESNGATAEACAKPKLAPRNTVAKRQRKQEKKARAALRHKLAAGVGVGGGRHMSSDEDDFSPIVIAQNLKVLQI